MAADRPHWNDESPESWRVRRFIRFRSRGPDNALHCGGCYRLWALEDVSAWIPTSINRVCAIDKTGTLYIGYSTNLRNRLYDLVRSIEARRYFNKDKHPTGKLFKSNKLLADQFPIDRLVLDWCYPKHPKNTELNLLWHYFECFGEAPPLNIERSTRWFDVSPEEAPDEYSREWFKRRKGAKPT